ncbi:MAG: type 11 methyltransferase [Myxococcales bacterium]|nr:type 11 methyltransferase [Myxococcales bacterium]
MLCAVALAAWLDQVLYRRPFEGTSARRYALAERPAFGDLDARLADGMASSLHGARRLLDVGCGPATFASLVAARYPALSIIALDPSRDFARQGGTARADYSLVRASGEALPIRDGVIDLAICLSSLRHVRDRAATLRELRRVVRPQGSLVIVELDPDADPARIATHADRLGTAILRRVFGPLVVKTAPRSSAIEALATAEGWEVRALRDDPVQPVYIMELA